jgi:methylase of polypeptide subunit release factors
MKYSAKSITLEAANVTFDRGLSPPCKDLMARGSDFFTALSSLITTLTNNTVETSTGYLSLQCKLALTLIALKNILFNHLVQSQVLSSKDSVSALTKANTIDNLLQLSAPSAPLTKEQLCILEEFLRAAPAYSPQKLSEVVAPLLNEDQHASGSFYTPSELCDDIIRESFSVLTSRSENTTFHILEPACGAGSFLLSLMSIMPASVVASITAIDKNPLALAIAELLLTASAYICKVALPHIHFRHDDFILPQSTNTSAETYDLIVGNPPFGLSRGGGFSQADLIAIKEKYRDCLKGKPNKYLLFLERGLQLLKPKGVLSFITPNAWLGIDGGRKFREKIITEQRILSLTKLPTSTWKKLGVETIVVTLSGEKLPKDYFQVKELSASDATPIDYAIVSGRTIPLCFDKNKESALREIIDNGIQLKFLSDDFFLAVGLQAYKTGGGVPPQNAETLRLKPFHHNTAKGLDWKPYLEGKNVTREGITTPSSFIYFGNHLAECPPLPRFQRPRILIREVLGKPPNLLIATPTKECLVYNRSILEIAPLGDDAWNVAQWLSSLLNSEYGSLQIELLGKKSQRALFPKIVLSDLKDFYIPKNWRELVNKI